MLSLSSRALSMAIITMAPNSLIMPTPNITLLPIHPAPTLLYLEPQWAHLSLLKANQRAVYGIIGVWDWLRDAGCLYGRHWGNTPGETWHSTAAAKPWTACQQHFVWTWCVLVKRQWCDVRANTPPATGRCRNLGKIDPFLEQPQVSGWQRCGSIYHLRTVITTLTENKLENYYSTFKIQHRSFQLCFGAQDMETIQHHKIPKVWLLFSKLHEETGHLKRKVENSLYYIYKT